MALVAGLSLSFITSCAHAAEEYPSKTITFVLPVPPGNAGDLAARVLAEKLSKNLKVPIDPKTTLLFFDEIQAAPRAIIALRYFYEEMPELHVVAAGSLLDFATQQVGMPVGRVQELEMYPLTFLDISSRNFRQLC